MAKQNSFDQFQESLENFDPDQYQAKEASYTYDEDFLGALDPEVANRFKQASEELDPELKAFADSVAFMEAVNLQKQANYIQQTIGGSEMFLNPKTAGVSNAEMAYLAGSTGERARGRYEGMGDFSSKEQIDAVANRIRKAEELKKAKKYSTGLAESLEHAPETGTYKAVGAKLMNTGREAFNYAKQDAGVAKDMAIAHLLAHKGKYMAGAGVAGAGALGAAIRSRRNAALQQGIGKAILGHLARNKGKYGLAAGAGALAAGGLYAKQASEEQLYVADLADTTYQFVQNLYNRNLSSHLAEESTTWEKSASYVLENQK